MPETYHLLDSGQAVVVRQDDRALNIVRVVDLPLGPRPKDPIIARQPKSSRTQPIIAGLQRRPEVIQGGHRLEGNHLTRKDPINVRAQQQNEAFMAQQQYRQRA